LKILAVSTAFIFFLLCSCSHEPLRNGYAEPNRFAGDAHRSYQRAAEANALYEDLLSQINRYRASNGLKALSFDKKLAAIAKGHCAEMNRCRVLSHDKFEQRFEHSRHTSCVENVASGYRDPKELFEAWRNSRGHDRNMLSKDIQIAGISMDGSYVTFFACDTRPRAYSVGKRVVYEAHSKS